MTTNYRSARRLSSISGLFTAFLLLRGLAVAQTTPSPENDRLVQTAKVWITVKYFHPYLAYKQIDWDKALIDALPKIRAANSSQAYATALQSMLDRLHDPATRVLTTNDGDHDAMSNSTASRMWIHNGFPPETGPDSGTFYSAFVARPASTPMPVIRIPLSDGIRVQVSLAEAVASDLPPIVKPDSYPGARYPSTEYRILAAYKIWGVIHHFFAYRDLMDEDWDDLFAQFLPRFVAAKDAREYNLTVADLLSHTLDSHVAVSSAELSDYFGPATVGIRLRLIEKKPVITDILDDNAKSAGLEIGDIVGKVDGASVPDRFNRIQDYVSGSTAQRRGYDSLQLVLNGPDKSTATLLVSSGDGPAKEVKVQRTLTFANAQPARSGESIRTLPGDIGYVDLIRLPDDQLPAIFEKLKDTKAIVFDARGPVSPAALQIASHLTSANDAAGSIITGPVTFSPDVATTRSLTSTASYFFVEKIPDGIEPKYTGKTVMLIDERTIGPAEHLGLWLEAANNTGFVGTPSAGADGETTNFVVPGGITITFSGQDIRHGNAGKLQRLGLQPAVLAVPTISGLQQGRDEVLEKAVEYLSPGASSRLRASIVLQ